MSRSRPLWKHVVAFALLILVIQRIGFRVLGDGPAGSLFIDIFAITANILAIACSFSASNRGRGVSRAFWILFASAITLQLLGDVGWAYCRYFNVPILEAALFPSLFYRLYAAPVLIALFLSDSIRKSRLVTFVDGCIIVGLAGLAMYQVQMAELSSRAPNSWKLVTFSTEIDATLALAALARFVFSQRGGLQRLFGRLAIYLTVHAGITLITSYVDAYFPKFGSSADLIWIVTCLSGAALAITWRSSDIGDKHGQARISRLAALLCFNICLASMVLGSAILGFRIADSTRMIGLLAVVIVLLLYVIRCSLMQNTLEKYLVAIDDSKAKLSYQALNDELTGLPNRRLLKDRLSQTLANARREKSMVALLYIDLDGFKGINDSLGHSIGDRLLSQAATRMLSRVRTSDTLARMGGDEFTVVVSHLSEKEQAAVVAKGLLDTLAEPFLVDEHTVHISASIGISIFPESTFNPAELIQQADSAMYVAKRGGRNGMRYYTPEMGSLVRERSSLETQMRGAVDRGEIALHYQPEFDVVSGSLVRFEALARWTHPDLGSIPPDKFIPIAEESGMIVALGTNILERACEEAVHWQALAPYPIQVAVNVSPLQFARDNFVDEVTHILNRTGLSPSLLQLELTESVVLSGVARAADTMNSLRALGVGLAIDDFGKGYSCLSYLSDLPFEALKIDRSFLKDLTTRRQTRVTVVSLIGLAHNLGMRVIVEGVENQDQMDLLRELGANEVQGYLLGRPTADPASLISLLFQRLKGRTALPKPFLDNSCGQPHPECVPATVVGSIGLANQSVHLN